MHLITYLISSLKKNKLRYLAVILGFSVAIGSMFSIFTFSDQLGDSIDDFFMVDQDTIMVTSKGTSILQIIPFSSKINESVNEEIMQVKGVKTIVPLIYKPYSYDGSSSSSSEWISDVIVGVNLDIISFLADDLTLEAGRLPNKDTGSDQKEIAIGNWVANSTLDVGDTMVFGNETNNDTFTIVGIFESKNPLFDHFIYCEYEEVQQIFEMVGFYTLLYVLFNSEYVESEGHSLEEITSNIEKINPNLQTLTSETIKENSGKLFGILNVFQFFISFIPYLISILFIFVMMDLNIKEQAWEFGIMRAIGVKRKQIALYIFLQTMLLVVISIGLGFIVGFFLFQYSSTVLFSDPGQQNSWDYAMDMSKKIPTQIYLQTILGILLTGVLVSILPSYKASKISIIEEIRKN